MFVDPKITPLMVHGSVNIWASQIVAVKGLAVIYLGGRRHFMLHCHLPGKSQHYPNRIEIGTLEHKGRMYQVMCEELWWDTDPPATVA